MIRGAAAFDPKALCQIDCGSYAPPTEDVDKYNGGIVNAVAQTLRRLLPSV